MNESVSAAPLFQTLHHIALVVEDLDATVGRLESLGFGPFEDYPPLAEYVELDVPDEEAFRALRIRVCSLGPVALQVIEAKDGDTIYGRFLRERGEGVFHLGFQVDDVDRAEDRAEKRGLRVLSRGRRADGSGFSYFDTRSEIGVTLLARQSPSG